MSPDKSRTRSESRLCIARRRLQQGGRAKWRRPYRTCDHGAAEDSQERNPKVEKLALLEAHDKAMTNHNRKRYNDMLSRKVAVLAASLAEIGGDAKMPAIGRITQFVETECGGHLA